MIIIWNRSRVCGQCRVQIYIRKAYSVYNSISTPEWHQNNGFPEFSNSFRCVRIFFSCFFHDCFFKKMIRYKVYSWKNSFWGQLFWKCSKALSCYSPRHWQTTYNLIKCSHFYSFFLRIPWQISLRFLYLMRKCYKKWKPIFPNDSDLVRRQEIVGELSHLGNLI